MILDKIRKYYVSAVCLFILCIYFISIVIINFSGNPAYYVTDMYSDMNYAAEVWTHKSIFPDGWIFGNQLYAVATPVLASIFYGLSNDHCIAMGIASTIMGIGVLLSFNWMLKPVFQTVQERLIGIIAFMSLVLASGDPIYSTNGWQLFFTMCSYYACYAITAFLAFGCYLHSDVDWSCNLVAILLLSCVLSFGTGIQSLRQTAIMVCPLIAVEILHMVYRIAHKEKVVDKSWIVTGLITVSNLSGVLYARIKNVDQVEIFGNIGIMDIPDALSNVLPSVSHALSLFVSASSTVAVVLAVTCLLVVFYIIHKFRIVKNRKAIICLLLFGISVAVMLIIDVFTTMYIRGIYYFLLYPLIAFLVISLHSYAGKMLHYLTVIVLVIIFAFHFTQKLSPIIQQPGPNTTYEEVVDYLEENNITTIFSGWNRGEKIGISSKWKIKAGFWDSPHTPFAGVNYLCDPTVFNADASQSAYVFFGDAEAAIAVEKANNMNVDFTLAKYFAESNVYIFTSKINIMQAVTHNHGS